MTTTSPSVQPREDRAPAGATRFAIILPLAFVTYSLAYLDRFNIGFGGAGGMKAYFTPDQYTWFMSSFFIGYVLFQIPGTSYAARHSVRAPLFWSLLFWGIIASLTPFLKTHYYLLLVDRFLLGAVEGLVFPSLLVFLTRWFTKRERSKANTILILGNPATMLLGSLASGALVDWFDAHRILGLVGWQWMLLIEGAPTILWAFIWLRFAQDHPHNSVLLAKEEAEALERVLAAEQVGLPQERDFMAAFREPRVWLLAAQFLAWSIGINGLNLWLPIILKQGSSLGMTRLGMWNAVPYLCGMTAMIVVSALSDRLLVRKPFVWPFLFIAGGGFLVAYLARDDFWMSFAGLVVAATCMYAPYGPFWAMTSEMVSRKVVGESVSLINTVGAIGGGVGSFAVGKLHEMTGGYGAVFAMFSICLAASAVLTLLVRIGQQAEIGAETIGAR
jgi:sugar phosphate permease